MEFKDRLLQTRKKQGLSQEELAELVGVSRQAVSKWETGEAQPDFAKLTALADALGVTLDYLCGREDENHFTVSAPAPQPKKRNTAVIVLGVLLGLFALVIVLLLVFNFSPRSRTVQDAVEAPPYELTISKAVFYYDDGVLTYTFLPSETDAHGSTTYQVYATSLTGGKSYILDAAMEGGTCQGAAPVDPGLYEVTVLVSRPDQQDRILLTSNLDLSEDGQVARWDPVEGPEIHHSETPAHDTHEAEEHDSHEEHDTAHTAYVIPASTAHHADSHDNHH